MQSHKKTTALSIFLILMTLTGFRTLSQELKKGDQAPEIQQQLVSGKEFKLSDLRGQLVLIDFWAAWCKPCRKANPEIVELYKEYKNEEFENGTGLEIVSISLDFKREMWTSAIEQDNLTWPYHLGGESGWKNPAVKKYNVSSIPTSFLVDGDGMIIGANLRGDELEKILRKYRKREFFFF